MRSSQYSNSAIPSERIQRDSALIIDAMDLLYLQHFDCFCIVSSDSDFTRLASRIREQGKLRRGHRGKKDTELIRQRACNEFIHIESANKERQEDKKTEGKLNKTEILLEKAASNS